MAENGSVETQQAEPANQQTQPTQPQPTNQQQDQPQQNQPQQTPLSEPAARVREIAQSIRSINNCIQNMNGRVRELVDSYHSLRQYIGSLHQDSTIHHTEMTNFRQEMRHFREDMRKCCEDMGHALRNSATVITADQPGGPALTHHNPCNVVYNGPVCTHGHITRLFHGGGSDDQPLSPQDSTRQTVENGNLRNVRSGKPTDTKNATASVEDATVDESGGAGNTLNGAGVNTGASHATQQAVNGRGGQSVDPSNGEAELPAPFDPEPTVITDGEDESPLSSEPEIIDPPAQTNQASEGRNSTKTKKKPGFGYQDPKVVPGRNVGVETNPEHNICQIIGDPAAGTMTRHSIANQGSTSSSLARPAGTGAVSQPPGQAKKNPTARKGRSGGRKQLGALADVQEVDGDGVGDEDPRRQKPKPKSKKRGREDSSNKPEQTEKPSDADDQNVNLSDSDVNNPKRPKRARTESDDRPRTQTVLTRKEAGDAFTIMTVQDARNYMDKFGNELTAARHWMQDHGITVENLIARMQKNQRAKQAGKAGTEEDEAKDADVEGDRAERGEKSGRRGQKAARKEKK